MSRRSSMLLTAVLAWPLAALSEPLAEPPLVPNATEIVRRCFENLYGFSSFQNVEIHVDLGAEQVLRKAQVLRRGTERGLNRMVVQLAYPADLRDVSILVLERPDLTYDAFLYQPIHDRVRRVSLAQRRDKFFGTDVSFEDLEAKRPDAWSAQFLRKEMLEGRNTSVIEMTPIEIPSSYDRIVMWFDDEVPVFLRGDFFRHGQLEKSVLVDATQVTSVGEHHVPTELRFHREGSPDTIIRVRDIQLVRNIPDAVFTRTHLEQRRSLEPTRTADDGRERVPEPSQTPD